MNVDWIGSLFAINLPIMVKFMKPGMILMCLFLYPQHTGDYWLDMTAGYQFWSWYFFFFLSRNLGWRLSNWVINHNSAFPSVIVAHVSGESHKKYDGKCIKKKTKIPSVCNGLVLYVCHWHQKDLFLEKVS